MDPLTPLDTLCRIILRAREYEAQTPSDYDGNESRRQCRRRGRRRSVGPRRHLNDSVEEELRAILEDLGEDQLAEVVAFCWVGQGTYEVAEWDEAMEEASALSAAGGQAAIDELLEMPMLASVLEAGLAAFELSCDGDRRGQLAPAKGITSQAYPKGRQDSGEARARRSRSGRGTNSRSSELTSSRANLGATLFWMVTCGRQPLASCAVSNPWRPSASSSRSASKLVRNDPIGDAAAEVHDAGNLRFWGRRLS